MLVLTGSAYCGGGPGKGLLKALRKLPANSWGALRGARPPELEFRTDQITLGNQVIRRNVAEAIKDKRIFSKAWGTSLKSSFYAESEWYNVFTGAVFQTQYQGRTEVFGVIPTHSLSISANTFLGSIMNGRSLKRNFTLQAFDAQGNAVPVQGEVAVLGAFGMMDMSLVKLDPAVLSLFTPLRISSTPARVGEELFSQGFIRENTVYIPERKVLQVTPFSVRTTMSGPSGSRCGLCGSPILNKNGEVEAFHTGSKTDLEEDIGYGTPAQLLNKLVEAYHNGGNASIPFELGGQIVTNLRVDEQVVRYILRDEEGVVLWNSIVEGKWPFNHVNKLLEKWHPRYIDLMIGRLGWDSENSQFVKFNPNVRIVRYDFDTRQQLDVDPWQLDIDPLYQRLLGEEEYF